MKAPFVSLSYFYRNKNTREVLRQLEVSLREIGSLQEKWHYFQSSGPLYAEGYEMCGIGPNIISIECSTGILGTPFEYLNEAKQAQYYLRGNEIVEKFISLAETTQCTHGKLGIEAIIKAPTTPEYESETVGFEATYVSKQDYNKSVIKEMSSIFSNHIKRECRGGYFYSASSIFGDKNLSIDQDALLDLRKNVMETLRE